MVCHNFGFSIQLIFKNISDVCSRPGVCGKGAICKAINSKAECVCPSGHRGNPYVECSIRELILKLNLNTENIPLYRRLVL